MPKGILTSVPLNQYTTLKIGGTADYLCEVGNIEELRAVCQWAKQTGTPLLVLGGGSNVLISDEGFRGLVVVNKIKKQEIIAEDQEQVTVALGAGEVFDEVVAWSVRNSWWGLENLSSIPGTVGATPVQNVGAYGVEVSALITKVNALNLETFEEKFFSNEECQFSYRDSFFKTTAGKKWIITEVVFKLSTQPAAKLTYTDLSTLISRESELTPVDVRNEIIAIRSKKFPDWTQVGTAGSFFKNPIITIEQYKDLLSKYPNLPGFNQVSGEVKVSLGFILDKICGLRGYCVGEVCLFENQALVLVAQKNATARDVKEFVNKISEKVFEKTKIKIECEVQII
jgi:UDP-N-acetylmuramate dehydrogenase